MIRKRNKSRKKKHQAQVKVTGVLRREPDLDLLAKALLGHIKLQMKDEEETPDKAA